MLGSGAIGTLICTVFDYYLSYTTTSVGYEMHFEAARQQLGSQHGSDHIYVGH